MELERERDIRWSWTRFQEELHGGEQHPFFVTPSKANVADATELAIIHVDAVGRLVRMEPPHLLDPYYEQNHRGRRTVEGEESPLLRP